MNSAANMASSLLRGSYGGGRYELIVDSHPTSAYVKSAEGGLVKGNIIDEPTGTHNLKNKHQARFEMEALSLDVGVASMLDLLKWFKDSWDKKATRRDGALVYADYNGKSQYEQWFYRALLTELTFPTLDAKSKEGVFVKVKMMPEEVALKQSPGRPVTGLVDPLQKMFSACAFQVEIDGIECSKVQKVEGISFKQGTKPVPNGRFRWPLVEPTKVEFSDVSIHMPMAHAGSMMDWYQSSVIKGIRDDKMQRTGAIVFLSADRMLPLFRISLDGVGIKGCSIAKADAGADSIKAVKFDLFVRKMGIDQTPSRDPMAYAGRAM